MAVTLTTRNTLLGALGQGAGTRTLAPAIVTVVLGTLFLTICSKISIPMQPVPVNLQTMGVAMLAAAFGWRIGLATVALFIVEGLAGLPVFTFGGGPGYVFSPTFGFILGFLPMAAVIGLAADSGASRRPLRLFAAMLAGDAIAFGLGFLWLAVTLGLAKGTAPMFGTAFNAGVAPFVVWDIVKMAFAAITVAGAFTLVSRKG
jgi:biotin transport system substrate-specific component